MEYFDVSTLDKKPSRVILGCMRISDMGAKEADYHMENAMNLGINFFDHSDIYGGGKCESVFGGVLKRHPEMRDKIIIQTKCGIRSGMYDFSKEHILESVNGSLSRLGLEHIDVLLLHRPDLLMEPEEVAAAFDELYNSGKVGAFGVSNHNPAQIELLQKYVRQKLSFNQIQLSIPHAFAVSSGANVNMDNHEGCDRDGYVRDYCRLHDITIQPWSPLQFGFFKGAFVGNPAFPKLNATLTELATKYGITETGMAIAWLLRMPEKMQPIVGTTNASRLREVTAAADICMSREDWYRIYRDAGYTLP